MTAIPLLFNLLPYRPSATGLSRYVERLLAAWPEQPLPWQLRLSASGAAELSRSQQLPLEQRSGRMRWLQRQALVQHALPLRRLCRARRGRRRGGARGLPRHAHRLHRCGRRRILTQRDQRERRHVRLIHVRFLHKHPPARSPTRCPPGLPDGRPDPPKGSREEGTVIQDRNPSAATGHRRRRSSHASVLTVSRTSAMNR